MFAGMQTFMEARQKQQAQLFKSLREDCQKQFEGMKSDPSKKAVSASTLPPYSGINPWRDVEHMVLADDMLHISEGLGSRSVLDLDFYPSIEHYLYAMFN